MRRIATLTLLLLSTLPACRRATPPGGVSGQIKPNILWVVWDTVRRDHLSVYGHQRPTTPRVEQWARNARVFTNCVSPGSTTVPAHVSMFTGRLPYQHGAHNRHPAIAREIPTLAELLIRGGYQTYLYSANSYVARGKQVTRGFDVIEHPWDDRYRNDAVRLIAEKIDPEDQSTELAQSVNAGDTADMPVIKAGRLARDGLERWLAQRDKQRPYFAFLNYMEAHRPFLPAREYREKFMSPEQLSRAHQLDRTWPRMWAHAFGVSDYSPQELELFSLLYDSALRELDDLFADLIESLEKRGELDNTIIILTADHGEHLGDHHLLDHQYSVYNELLYVPLIVYYPPAFEAGRDDRPLMNFDLFPTLLRLAGEPVPDDTNAGNRYTIDLRDVPLTRRRLGEYPQWMPAGLKRVREIAPDFDETPWQRVLRAYYSDPYKLIWTSDGRHELYDLSVDPHELHNLAAEDEPRVRQLIDELNSVFDIRRRGMPSTLPDGDDDAAGEELRRMEALGYAAPGEEDDDEADDGRETP